ncbi:MAG: envelope stress response membrane protein PspC [Desulfarculaceae bacterium]|jgi:phage shock protein C
MRLNEFSSRKGIYRSRHGLVLGVCRGLAEYFDLSVKWVRILTLVAFIFTGFWPVGLLYLILGLILKPAPVIRPASEAEEEFYRSYTGSRSMALNRLQRTYQNLERRLRRMEDVVTSRDFHWETKARS